MNKTKAQTFYGHGKLLLTGEYAVLDGAKALSIPTRFGQSLEVTSIADNQKHISWESFTVDNEKWLSYDSNDSQQADENEMLEKILNVIKELNPDAFGNDSFQFKTHLEFNRKWGLGSSSSLLYCLSEWANVDPFVLLEKTFGGSGYDLASAGEDQAIFYTKKDNKASWEAFDLKLPMQDNLFFVYLGKKKNSREAIAHYRESKSTDAFLQRISDLGTTFSTAKDLKTIQGVILEHETILSERLKTPTLNKSIFADLNGAAKSLGGWGGDFVLIATEWNKEELTMYINKKEMETIFSYDEMVFKK